MVFLTDLDERAEIKGSRDPLGMIPIWSRFGRTVVGNLTTQANNVRGFTTLLLGLLFAEELQESDRESRPSMIETFLKFEQMAAYVRLSLNRDGRIRGLRRVEAVLGKRGRIRISAGAGDQILSNQKVYGLWGLYTTPGRTSALLIPGDTRLSPVARDFVERTYLPMLPGRGRAVIDLLRRPSFELDLEGRHAALAKCIGKVHAPKLSEREAEFYRDHLTYGGPSDSTGGKQRQLAEILAAHESDDFQLRDFKIVREKARRSGALAESLDRIGAVERLLMPARAAFLFLLLQDRQPIRDVERALAREWRTAPKADFSKLSNLAGEWTEATRSKDQTALWLRIAEALSNNDAGSIVKPLLALNARVMQSRNGSAPWIAEEAGRLKVRVSPSEGEPLRPARDVDQMWRSTFFINSLWTVARETGA